MLMKTKEKARKRGRKWRRAQEGSDAKSVTTKALRHGEKIPNFLASAPLWWRDVAAGLPRQSSHDFQVALAG